MLNRFTPLRRVTFFFPDLDLLGREAAGLSVVFDLRLDLERVACALGVGDSRVDLERATFALGVFRFATTEDCTGEKQNRQK